jgi:transcriptional regulator with XRE-family HTH domain
MKTISNRPLAVALALDTRARYVIAAEIGVPPQFLSGYVSGRVEPTEEKKARIAEVLGLTISELFGE